MRTLQACALSLALLPATSFAEIDQTGKAHCKDFAAQQLKELKQESYAALTRDETDLALQVAERSCKALRSQLEQELETVRTEAAAEYNKPHMWERMELEDKETPRVRHSQNKGGK